MNAFTLVALHAHPDDEALLTGGTLARAAAEGHRVVLITATSGELGLAGEGDGTGAQLANIRLAELHESARALHCSRVVTLNHPDSGLHPDPDDRSLFAHLDAHVVAEEVAAILREESADALLIYDANGGYGHPDHIQVHRVGSLAARLAQTPVVLEATVPDTLFKAVLAVLRLGRHALGSSAPLGVERVFSPAASITHRVDVRRHLAAKRAALAAHGSQQRAEGEVRVLDRLLRLPDWAFGLVFGREWYVEQGAHSRGRQDDIFASLRRHNP